MTRRIALLVMVSLLLLPVAIVGGIRLVAAMQGGDQNTDMTKSVARIMYDSNPSCSGSVVGDDWVLTALHCLYPKGSKVSAPRDWHKFKVQLWQAGVDISPKYESDLSEPPIQMAGAVTYPDGTNEENYRDVMLLHVAKHMNNTYSWIKTIPTAPAWPAINTSLTEYGYGRISPKGPVSAGLNKSQQGAITRIDCPDTKVAHKWTSGHLCIHSSVSRSYGGDSGGPLLWWHDNYWQEVGSLIGIPNLEHDTVRAFWSEVDGDTRNWILSTVGANFTYGTILRDQDGGTTWLYATDGYEDDLYRHRIPDAATFNCLVNNGATVLNRPLRTIEALPDKANRVATCIPKSPTVTPPTVTPPTVTPPTVTPPTVTPMPHRVDAYSNYGQSNLAGHAMCRGNPSNPVSMPGGVGSQTFTVPDGVATLDSALVQIDPASVTAHMTIFVNGNPTASAAADAVGDTHFAFASVSVHPGDQVTLRIEFTATYGKIITLYTVGNPGGMFTASNSCPDGAPNFQTTTSGLRAVVSGWSN